MTVTTPVGVWCVHVCVCVVCVVCAYVGVCVCVVCVVCAYVRVCTWLSRSSLLAITSASIMALVKFGSWWKKHHNGTCTAAVANPVSPGLVFPWTLYSLSWVYTGRSSAFVVFFFFCGGIALCL